MAALLPIPALQYVERHMDVQRVVVFTEETWTMSLYATAIYLLLVFQGRKWMQSRKPYDLRKPMILWNIGLAVFSVLGTAAVAPSLLRTVFTYGVDYAVCFSDAGIVPRVAVWCYMFGLSKLLELGDTAFIVLRKSPLPFLHWYHHITVMIYTIYGITDPIAVGHFFAAMNYAVHSLMYSYYTCRAIGFRVPRWMAQFITTLQLSQMFVGVYVTCLALYNNVAGRVPGCIVRYDLVYLGAAMYCSYAVLFLHFFYHKYCSPKDKSKKQ